MLAQGFDRQRFVAGKTFGFYNSSFSIFSLMFVPFTFWTCAKPSMFGSCLDGPLGQLVTISRCRPNSPNFRDVSLEQM